MIGFWTHALAALSFGALVAWQLHAGLRMPGQRLLLAALGLTALWAWCAAVRPESLLAAGSETGRNLIWIAMLHSLAMSNDERERQKGIRLVYGAVAGVLGLQMVADALPYLMPPDPTAEAAIATTAALLRITAAAGGLVLVHNIYGQAAPASRPAIGYAMVALAMLWIYDLNLYTVAYLSPAWAEGLGDWRGLAVAATAPFFAMGARRTDAWRIRLSRAATFQSLSLLGICGYLAVMAVLATVLRGAGGDWATGLAVALLSALTVAAMVILPSARARSWAKVKIAKHFFEHRYDYRAEWLRFTATLGSGDGERPGGLSLGQRTVKAFADILDAPGGVLIARDEDGQLVEAAEWNWPGEPLPVTGDSDENAFWAAIASEGRIVELDGVRHGWSQPQDLKLPFPGWMLAEETAWIGVPLMHHNRLTAIILLAAPDYRRPLDWEDFDLLRTAGRQAASNIAEALTQEVLSKARRFEEFNRRFAFILHDIKNLVSQLSLLARNAERHADNAEFRADMVATLKSSVGKMNDLLARLSPQSAAREGRCEPTPLKDVLAFAIAAKRRGHEVQLLGDTSIVAMADPHGLETAVGHLVQNAIDASPEDVPVTVRVEHDLREVRILVIDKGRGMDGDFVRASLFEPFSSTKEGGFGIGAYEARSLVTAMGGRLSVESRLNHGSQFTIHLPAATAAKERKSA
nr:XrtA/PEP-CTERM system histidine kinase PrsK [Sphingomicrobium nitratireducens]